MCSLYQLIYSFRDTIDSEIPNFTSQNAKDALYKILEIRDKISSSNKKYLILIIRRELKTILIIKTNKYLKKIEIR